MIEAERTTLATYRGYVDKHIRPLIGHQKVGAIDADILDSFYAELRRCRDHCRRRRTIDHRTDRPHACDARCRRHVCTPLSAWTIRKIHFIISGAYQCAVRWKWVAVNPAPQAEPPSAPHRPAAANHRRGRPHRHRRLERPRLRRAGLAGHDHWRPPWRAVRSALTALRPAARGAGPAVQHRPGRF
jgi:hypothetical protein